MEINSSIGERLEEERLRLALSQSQVAQIAKDVGVPGATRQSQARYEKGQAAPSAAYMSAISSVGFDVLYIITGQRSQPVTSTALNRREAALLDNYRHSGEEGKNAIEGTASALAQSAQKPLKKQA